MIFEVPVVGDWSGLNYIFEWGGPAMMQYEPQVSLYVVLLQTSLNWNVLLLLRKSYHWPLQISRFCPSQMCPWGLFIRATSSELYSQYPPSYMHRFESPSFPTYSFGKNDGPPLRKFFPKNRCFVNRPWRECFSEHTTVLIFSSLGSMVIYTRYPCNLHPSYDLITHIIQQTSTSFNNLLPRLIT